MSFTLRYGINYVMSAGMGRSEHPLVAELSIMRRVFG